MKTYIVRTIEGKDLVGTLKARDKSHLYEQIDEVCDPKECEYAEYKVGGILFHEFSNGSADFEYREKSEEDLPSPKGFQFSEELNMADFKWKKDW